MMSRWMSALCASCAVVAVAGCVPYQPYAGAYAPQPYGGYAPPPYSGYSGDGYDVPDQGPVVGYYPQPRPYRGYEGAQFDGEYGRRRGDGGQVFREQQSYNRAVVTQQRQQNQVVQQQQNYNNAVVAQQNAYNQALLAQQRAAQGR